MKTDLRQCSEDLESGMISSFFKKADECWDMKSWFVSKGNLFCSQENVYIMYMSIYAAVNYFMLKSELKCNFNTSSLSSPHDFPVLFNFFFHVFHTLQTEGRYVRMF